MGPDTERGMLFSFPSNKLAPAFLNVQPAAVPQDSCQLGLLNQMCFRSFSAPLMSFKKTVKCMFLVGARVTI